MNRAVRWAKHRIARNGIILLYHSIASCDSDPWSLSIPPERFAEHLSVLRTLGQPMRLQDMVRMLQRNQLPSRPVVVTFDDGYANNLSQGKALLARYDVPATVFVTTGVVGQPTELWWDELDRLLLQPGILPKELMMTVSGMEYRWDLGATTCYSDQAFQTHRSWRVWDGNAPSPRHALFCALYDLLFPLPNKERQDALDNIAAWSGAGRVNRPSHRTLTAEEVQLLAEDGLIEIGAHSVTHAPLSALSPEAQSEEIRNSKRVLEGMLGTPVRSFAYPFGRTQDYSQVTPMLVREAGYNCACTAIGDLVARKSDPFELPRYTVPAVDGEEFARLMTELLSS